MHSNVCRFGKQVTPCTTEMTFRTERRVPRLGVMLVGWGGNNGTTVTAAVLANSLGLTWRTKTGVKVGRGTVLDIKTPKISYRYHRGVRGITHVWFDVCTVDGQFVLK